MLFGSFIGILFISEAIKIGVLKRIDEYYFGPGADNPYYYNTAEFYSVMCAAEGLVLFSISVIGIILIVKRKWRKVSIISLILLILMVAQVINSKIVI